LLLGAKWSQIATLAEHQSRYATLVRLPSRDTDIVIAAVARHIRRLHLRGRSADGTGERRRKLHLGDWLCAMTSDSRTVKMRPILDTRISINQRLKAV